MYETLTLVTIELTTNKYYLNEYYLFCENKLLKRINFEARKYFMNQHSVATLSIEPVRFIHRLQRQYSHLCIHVLIPFVSLFIKGIAALNKN